MPKARTTNAPPFPLSAGREPIRILEGPIQLGSDSGNVRGYGHIDLAVQPTPRFVFTIDKLPSMFDWIGQGEVVVGGLGGSLQGIVGEVSMGQSGLITGVVAGALGDPNAAAIAEVRFYVVNLPFFVGAQIQSVAADPRDGVPGRRWSGRLSFAVDGWEIDLDLRADFEAVYSRLKRQGGFDITHIGALRRADGSYFSGLEAEEIGDSLGEFLGLACAAWAPPTAAVGLGGDGKIVWFEMKPRLASPWNSHLRVFDLQKHGLAAGFVGYLGCRNRSTWREPLRIATQLYVEANGPVAAEIALVLSQSALELIAWVHFVEDLRTFEEFDFDRLKPSGRLRELLTWLKVESAIPDSLTELRDEAAAQGWKDGPHAIGAVRNALIHPRQRDRLASTPTAARIELRDLVVLYLELSLLRLTCFVGSFSNRLGDRISGVVEPVPWN